MSQAEFLRGFLRPRPHSTKLSSGARRLLIGSAGVLALLSTLAPNRVDAQGAGQTISGRVTDAATGAPIQQARVLIAGTQVGSLTAENGRYSFRATQTGAVTLEVSRIGYEAKKVAITIGATPVTADVALTQAAFSL